MRRCGRSTCFLVIHEEIDRLPQRYRGPIVLCCLEQMTYQQAARQLRLSEATTQGRLARARNLLRARLTHRGVALGSVPVASLAGPRGNSTVPLAIFQATLRSARHFDLGEAAGAAAASTAADVLVNQAMRSMMIATFTKVAAAAASSRQPDRYRQRTSGQRAHDPRGTGGTCEPDRRCALAAFYFESNTSGAPGSFLRCQNDGNLVIYTRDVISIWTSHTHSRPPEEDVP